MARCDVFAGQTVTPKSVHQGEIGMMLFMQAQRLGAGGCLRGELELWIDFQHGGHAGADRGMVIHEKQANGRGGGHGDGGSGVC